MTPDRIVGRGVMFGSLLLSFFGCSLITAGAEEITFRIAFGPGITIPQNTRIIGYIKMKAPPQMKWQNIIQIFFPDPGVQKTDQIKCSVPGIFFTAELKNIFYQLNEIEAERQCRAGEIVFTFHEKTYADLLRKALEGIALKEVESSPPKGQFKLASADAKDDRIHQLQADLTKAIESGDTAQALIKSSEIHNNLSQIGLKSAAEPYRILNLDIAKTKLTGKSTSLFFDSLQSKYVLDKEATTQIKALQMDRNLAATGKLNWPTMKLLGIVD